MAERFPDVLDAIDHVLAGLVTTVRWMPAQLDTLPVAHIRRRSGQSQTVTWQRTVRVQIDMYGQDRDATEQVAEQVRDRLENHGGPHVTPAGLIDRITVDLEPADTPFIADDLSLITLTVSAVCRATH
ncbi:DUF3168 domain-containing protein [Actinobaculum sp. 352]|uniref:DUF3168 domain-containing protein n=1 Tax=Actinobaculum sp. 352 TaxID=2490946 RepID=UPI000F7D5F6F|nr:DUF3168 domain-containing protein [Actinobaculum sp. 352]RTE48826.1 DUF3168 domain-containing protein [Actinobaculum sp. 352]